MADVSILNVGVCTDSPTGGMETEVCRIRAIGDRPYEKTGGWARKDSTWFDEQTRIYVVKYEHTFEENEQQSLSRLRRASCLRATPVAALAVHWTAIHHRDDASLTPGKGRLWVRCKSER